MRIAFLFEPSTPGDIPCEWVFNHWLNGLVESQNLVKVITRPGTSERFQVNPKIDWAEPMKTWGWWEFPKLIAAIMPFNPEIIHLVIHRTPNLWQLWPAMTHIPGQAAPIVLSLADSVKWPNSWKGLARRLEPKISGALAVPSLIESSTTLKSSETTVFVPGPLSEHSDWQMTLEKLMTFFPKRRDWNFKMGWQWTDIPLPMRLDMRRMWMESVSPIQVTFLENPTLENQAQAMAQSNLALLSPLQEGWTRALFQQTASIAEVTAVERGDWFEDLEFVETERRAEDKRPPTEGAINQLSRVYHQSRGLLY